MNVSVHEKHSSWSYMFAHVFCDEELDGFGELLVVVETAVGGGALQRGGVLLRHAEERFHCAQLSHEEDVLEEAHGRFVEGSQL